MATKERKIGKVAQAKVVSDQHDAVKAAATARTIVRPSVNAAAVVAQYAKETFGELDIDALVSCLSVGMDDLASGDLRRAEAMLYGQAHALQAIFTNMARRAPKQDLMCHWDAYMRVALKAQNQCRMTLETLATIKNPPVVFAKQANINNGGQQQVNNGAAPPQVASPEQPEFSEQYRARTHRAGTHGHASNSQAAPTELLEAIDVQRMDTGAASTTGGTDQGMAPVGAINRAPHK